MTDIEGLIVTVHNKTMVTIQLYGHFDFTFFIIYASTGLMVRSLLVKYKKLNSN